MSEIVVAARALTKIYGTRRAVDGVDFTVERGESFGLLGPNGAGKSTTMRMIACRSPLTAGELRVENLDVRHEARRIRRLIGVVPQENNLDPDLSVLQNLLVYARYFHISPEVARLRSRKLLEFINLSSRTSARVEELSGGMKRRLMIARALLHEPRILVLDEPTTGLDPHVRQEIWQRLAELRRLMNLTLLLSTHYMDEAEKLCEHVIIMNHGRIAARGRPRDLITAEADNYVLEIRETNGRELPTEIPLGVRVTERGGAHLFSAARPEMLAPLMKLYGEGQFLLRPSNLEDVFLHLVVGANEDMVADE